MENMEKLEINSFFSEEDRKFNRQMVQRLLRRGKAAVTSEHRGGKMPMNSFKESRIYQNRQYDFSSEILDEYRRKWGLSE